MQGYTYFFPIAYAATDVTVYQQDVVIHRSEGASYEETVGDFKVWHVYVGNRCKSDYGDVRFTDASGNALAYYLWPDYDAESARFTVRLEGATSAGTLVIWYGNPAATTTSDGDRTYFLFDDFLGTSLNLTKWNVKPGTPYSVSGGALIIGNGAGDYGIYSKTYLHPSSGVIVDGRIKFASASGDLSGFGSMYSLANMRAGLVAYWPNEDRLRIIRYDGDYYDSDVGCYATVTKYNDFRAVLSPTHLIGYAGAKTCSVPNTLGSYPISIRSWGGVTVDCVAVRAYSATPPAATAFGPEQVPGTLHHVQGVVFGSANMMVI